MNHHQTKRIVGQDKVIRLLEREWLEQQLTGSYLLEGPKAVGKQTTARHLVQRLLCQNPLATPCGECVACHKIERHLHPDVLQITPLKGVITVEAGREILAHLQFPPLEAKRRVVIIDDAELLNSFAANSLLKTLEEPPPNTLLILIAARPTALPATLLSRLKRFRFAPLSPEDRAKIFGISPLDVRLLSLSSGDDETADADNRLQSLKKQHTAIVTAFRQVFTVADGKLTVQPTGLWALASELLEGDEQLAVRLGMVQGLVRDLYLLKNGVTGTTLMHHEELSTLQPIAAQLPAERLTQLLEQGESLMMAVQKRHVNSKIAVEYFMSAIEGVQ